MASNHHVLIYALTTCVHCRHVKDFLEKNNTPYQIVYVDTLEGKDRSEILEKMRSVNPRISFPTIVIDEGREVIIGFQPQRLSRVIAV